MMIHPPAEECACRLACDACPTCIGISTAGGRNEPARKTTVATQLSPERNYVIARPVQCLADVRVQQAALCNIA